MKITLLSVLLLSGLFCYPQETRREQRIREWNERIELQDHLEPEQGDLVAYKFSIEYHSQIRSILLDTLGDSPIIRMIVLPSFSPEYVISLEQLGNKFIVTRIDLDSSIWYSKYPQQIKKYITSKVITTELTDSLSSLYLLTLSKTRYPSEPIFGSDGTNYHFAAKSHFGIQTGTKWSPRKGTRIAELVELTEALLKDMDEKELINSIIKLKDQM